MSERAAPLTDSLRDTSVGGLAGGAVRVSEDHDPVEPVGAPLPIGSRDPDMARPFAADVTEMGRRLLPSLEGRPGGGPTGRRVLGHEHPRVRRSRRPIRGKRSIGALVTREAATGHVVHVPPRGFLQTGIDLERGKRCVSTRFVHELQHLPDGRVSALARSRSRAFCGWGSDRTTRGQDHDTDGGKCDARPTPAPSRSG